ncbi:MAG: hypothetical protein ACXADY_20830 [Candidatus Hodarchaeales archaeon]
MNEKKKYDHIPDRLRAVRFPGKQIELWIKDRKISKVSDVPPKERPFIRDFIENLKGRDWTVLIEENDEQDS